MNRCLGTSLSARISCATSLSATHTSAQIIVESDFSLPTFASCLFRLRGDSKAIAGHALPAACDASRVTSPVSVPCSSSPGVQGQVALQFLSDRPLRVQLIPSNTIISLPCAWDKVNAPMI
jgi:hypothetical protein